MVDYCTRGEVRAYGQFKAADTANDSLLDDLITRVSRAIDALTGRTFAPASDTSEYFTIDDTLADEGRPRDLFLGGKTLLSLTSITNADGTSIATGDVLLRPQGSERKHLVRIKSTSTSSWVRDPDGEIAITGKWGYSAGVPDEVRQAAVEWVNFTFHQRGTPANPLQGSRVISPDGAVIKPEAAPGRVHTLLAHLKRKL